MRRFSRRRGTRTRGRTCAAAQREVFDYGPIRTPAVGALTVPTVYRAGRIVNAAEYSIEQPIPGLSVVRFMRSQRDGQGSPMGIQADLVSTQFAAPSDALRFLLNDSTYGLGLAVDAVSIAQADRESTTSWPCGVAKAAYGGLLAAARQIVEEGRFDVMLGGVTVREISALLKR
jgi:hypothetical protein